VADGRARLWAVTVVEDHRCSAPQIAVNSYEIGVSNLLGEYTESDIRPLLGY